MSRSPGRPPTTTRTRTSRSSSTGRPSSRTSRRSPGPSRRSHTTRSTRSRSGRVITTATCRHSGLLPHRTSRLPAGPLRRARPHTPIERDGYPTPGSPGVGIRASHRADAKVEVPLHAVTGRADRPRSAPKRARRGTLGTGLVPGIRGRCLSTRRRGCQRLGYRSPEVAAGRLAKSERAPPDRERRPCPRRATRRASGTQIGTVTSGHPERGLASPTQHGLRFAFAR